MSSNIRKKIIFVCIIIFIIIILTIIIYASCKLYNYFLNEQLLEACLKGDISQVEELIERGADTNYVGNLNETPLLIAILNSDLELIELLVQHGADTDFKIGTIQRNALILSVKHECEPEITEYFIKKGLNVESAMSNGNTALILAASKGFVSKAEILINNAADINARNDARVSPILSAVRSEIKSNRYEMINFLLDKGATYTVNEGLLIFSTIGDRAKVNELIEKGADVNYKHKESEKSALLYAIEAGHFEIVEILIENGSNVNQRNSYGGTGLSKAVANNDLKITELLIKNGADVNLKSDKGFTALILATIEGNKQIVELLIKNGAQVNVETYDGKTALSEAKEKNYTEIIEILKKAGAR